MKKEITFLLILLLLPAISALEISLSKENYQPQEILQLEITGNFIEPLTINNIFLYKQNIPRSTPVQKDLTKFQDTYYFYALLPNQEANFSIKIENAKYTESGVQKTDTIIKNFTMKKTNQSALQINQGFIKTNKDFSIKIKSLHKNQDISAVFEKQTENFSLTEDSEKTIVFSVSGIKTGKYDLKINDYTVPVFVIEKTQLPENNETANQTQKLNETIANKTEINIENKTKEEIKALHCSEIEDGKICEDNEKCSGKNVASLDGSCCVGKCIEKKQSSFGFWIGVILILIILVTITFFYFKTKKKKPPTSEEILNQKEKKFSERMKGEEVAGSLGKI